MILSKLNLLEPNNCGYEQRKALLTKEHQKPALVKLQSIQTRNVWVKKAVIKDESINNMIYCRRTS